MTKSRAVKFCLEFKVPGLASKEVLACRALASRYYRAVQKAMNPADSVILQTPAQDIPLMLTVESVVPVVPVALEASLSLLPRGNWRLPLCRQVLCQTRHLGPTLLHQLLLPPRPHRELMFLRPSAWSQRDQAMRLVVKSGFPPDKEAGAWYKEEEIKPKGIATLLLVSGTTTMMTVLKKPDPLSDRWGEDTILKVFRKFRNPCSFLLQLNK